MCEGVSAIVYMQDWTMDWTMDWTGLSLINIVMMQIKQPYTHRGSKYLQNYEIISGSV